MIHESKLRSANDPDAPLAASTPLLVMLVVLLGGSFFFSELDWRVSTYENYAIPPEEAEALVEAGNRTRQAAYVLIGLLGSCLLISPARQKQNLWGLPTLLIGGYYLTCVASIVWSDDPSLSLKRVVVLSFCLLAILGVVRQLTARDLLNLTLAIATGLTVVGIANELVLGTFRPFDAAYRFAGTVHPNTQGAYCGVMVTAAFFGRRSARGSKSLYGVLLCLGAVLLLLTKSRSCLGACLIGLPAAWFVGTSRSMKTLVGLGAPWAVCSLLIAISLCGIEVTSELDSAAKLGRQGLDSGFEGLNGRLPLWLYLSEFIVENPLLGHGYHGFWTAERIYEVSIEQAWTVPSAHSVYLDVLLSVGLLGGTLFALIVLLGLRRAAQRAQVEGEPAECFLLSMLVFAVVSSVFESGFAQPTSFDSFLAACGLCCVLLRPAVRKMPAVPRAPAAVLTAPATGSP